MHNLPIMISSSSASNWESGACTYSNKGGKYCTMCASPHLKHQAVLTALVAVVAVPAAVVSASVEVANEFLSAPTPWAVIGTPELVAKKAKASKESALATLDKFAFRCLLNRRGK
jgi:hypothetical protein